MILGIDASTYLEELRHGAVYRDGGVPIDPLEAFLKNGVDCMRIRVWNDPKSETGEPYLAGNCDLDNYIRLGQLAKSKGYRLMMDLHYSDFWADPGKQMIPKAWRGYDLPTMIQAVYCFTRDCLVAAREAGVAPDYVQVGNEITNGILWPVGKLQPRDGIRGNYDRLLALIDAGCRACREEAPEAKILLHLERSNDQAVYQEFFSQVEAAGIDYDVIAASYYPYWHGTPEALFANLRNCRRFGKALMIAELAYGFTTDSYCLDGQPQRLVIDATLADASGLTDRYPLTPAGQAAFIREFLARAKEEDIDGVFYWEPLWLPGKGICWASGAGQAYIHEEGKSTANEWANQCLFDYTGEMLPAFGTYAQF